MTRDDLEAALLNPNVIAFLRVIRAGETDQTDAAYTEVFGGGHFVSNMADHPRHAVTIGTMTSTAAGAYQILSRTWDGLVATYSFTDFQPHTQDLAAVALIVGRRALPQVISGNLQAAIAMCCKEWASLPGSPYGQPVRTMAQAEATYAEYGGSLMAVTAPPPVPIPDLGPAEPAPAPRSSTMPFLIPLLEALASAIPSLAAKWGPDMSVVATRNTAIATTVAQSVMSTLGAVNEQDAIQKLQSDPTALDKAKQVVQDMWWQIDASGVSAAREADKQFVATKTPLYYSPSFVAMCAMLPLVYGVMGAVIGLYGNLKLDPGVQASIITGLTTLIVGGAAAYYWGAMTTANKPAPSPSA